MPDTEQKIGQTITELKIIFREFAALGFGPAKPLIDRMAENALVGLEAAELEFNNGLIPNSVNTTRMALNFALGEEHNIIQASGNNKIIRALCSEFAEKAIVKGIDILDYGRDVFTDYRSEMARVLEMRKKAAKAQKPPTN